MARWEKRRLPCWTRLEVLHTRVPSRGFRKPRKKAGPSPAGVAPACGTVQHTTASEYGGLVSSGSWANKAVLLQTEQNSVLFQAMVHNSHTITFSPLRFSGIGGYSGCISPLFPVQFCSCPQRPCTPQAGWPVVKVGRR